jgi:hypothetical protein
LLGVGVRGRRRSDGASVAGEKGEVVEGASDEKT